MNIGFRRMANVLPHTKPACLARMLGVCFTLMIGPGCIAQQADLAKIQKDLETQISKIKEEKRALGSQVEDAKTAISDSQTLIAQQKADMAKLRSDLAPLNQQVKLLREQDLTSLYGKNEVVEKRIRDLENSLKQQSDSVQALGDTVTTQGDQLQSAQAQTTALIQQVDEKNQALTNTMGEFQKSLTQFKEVMGDVGTKLQGQREDLTAQHTSTVAHDERLQTLDTSTKELSQGLTQLREAMEQSGTLLGGRLDEQGVKVNHLQEQTTTLQDKLEKDTQALRAYLEKDVQAALTQVVKDVESQQQPVHGHIEALQKDMEILGTHVQADATQVQELSQSVLKLREAQDVMGSLLGKRGDEIIQQAGRLSERMTVLESHQSELTQQLQSNTQKTGTHLTEVTASLKSLSQAFEQTTQSLGNRISQQEDTLKKFQQTAQQFDQLQQKTAGQVAEMKTAVNMTDQLRQSIEEISKRLQDLEIHQSGLVGKLDSDAQNTNTHLKEVNKSIESVAQALESVSHKLNTRMEDQEQRLNRAMTNFQKVQGVAEGSQANLNHLNQLTETVNQLRDVVNTIGTKLGERVDEHEDRLGQLAQHVNRLQGTKPKK
ncbi:MAG: hypothetical protein AB7P17_04575 [Nitrospirales bacterium]|nr:hypothetical protein [Nitrospirales bacterium]